VESSAQEGLENPPRQEGAEEGMTIRHAAALALVGWYLMTQPFDRASLKHV
jgi:hypothetical protein